MRRATFLPIPVGVTVTITRSPAQNRSTAPVQLPGRVIDVSAGDYFFRSPGDHDRLIARPSLQS